MAIGLPARPFRGTPNLLGGNHTGNCFTTYGATLTEGLLLSVFPMVKKVWSREWGAAIPG